MVCDIRSRCLCVRGRIPIRTTYIGPAPLDDDIHVVEGVYEETGLAWMAVVTAFRAENGTKINSLPAAAVLAAAGQMLDALRAVQTADNLDEIRAMVERAIQAATTLPDLSQQDDEVDPIIF
jgi:hypothetical protein